MTKVRKSKEAKKLESGMIIPLVSGGTIQVLGDETTASQKIKCYNVFYTSKDIVGSGDIPTTTLEALLQVEHLARKCESNRKMAEYWKDKVYSLRPYIESIERSHTEIKIELEDQIKINNSWANRFAKESDETRSWIERINKLEIDLIFKNQEIDDVESWAKSNKTLAWTFAITTLASIAFILFG